MAASVKNYYDAILLDPVLKAIIRREEDKSVFSKRLQRSARGIIKDIRGNYIVSKTEIYGEQGIGARGRKENYPTARESGFLDAKVGLKRNYASIECWGDERILSDTPRSEEAVTSIILDKGRSIMENFAIDQARQYWGDGSGELAKVDTTQTGVTTIKVSKTQYLRRNMLIDIHESSVIEDRAILEVSKKNKTIKIDGAAVNVTDGTVITRADSKDKEMIGVPSMVDDGTVLDEYENIKRSEFEEWASLALYGQGNPFDLTVLDELFTKLIYDYDGNPTIAYMDSTTLLSIVYLCKKKGLAMSTVKLELGYEAPQYITPKGPVALIVEKECPANTFATIDESTLSLRRPRPPHFIKGVDGFWMPHPDKDMDYARLRYYSELFCLEPWKNAKYTGYQSAVGS